MVDNQRLMMENFRNAMKKLAIVGQDTRNLVDCSEMIPIPKAFAKKLATYGFDQLLH